jgi:predicted ATPase
MENPMIESIQFENFKALRKCTLPLSRCTVLIGQNGSGKSTVLQALEAFSSAQTLSRENVVSVSAPKHATVKVSLHWPEPCKGIASVLEWESSGNCSKGLENPSGERHDSWDLNAFQTGIRIFSLDATAIAGSVPMGANIKLARDGAGLAGVLTHLQDRHRERFDALNDELARWLPEFDCVMFDFDDQSHRLFSLRTRDGQHEIRAADLSNGTLITLAMLTLAHLPEPPTLIGLEEPDRGIHPRLLRRVQDAIYHLSHPESCKDTRKPVQVIATTHSPYFVDLFKDHPEEIVVANKTGQDVQFERISERPHFKEILEDAPLGEAWFTGILGGVPSRS